MPVYEKAIALSVVPMDFTYNYRVGPYMERFIKGLGEKKILGVKCPECKKVVVPPRKVCGVCNKILDEWVEVGPEGTVENYTVGHVKLNKGLVEQADPPVLLALVKLDGASSLLPAKIEGIDSGELKNGLKVKAIFKDQPEDSLDDLDHFEPVG